MNRLRCAVVAGAIANKAGQGGESWVRLSWVRGLQELGFGVHLLERLAPGAPDDAVDYFRSVVASFGIEATLLDDQGSTLVGLDRGDLADQLADAEVLFDISGHLTDDRLRDRCRRRVYVDLDPGFTQLWHRAGLVALDGYDYWYTVGLNVGDPRCAIPGDAVPWRPMLPPVVLADWPDVSAVDPGTRFTTVSSWRAGSGSMEFEGRHLGGKAREFRRLLPLPGLAAVDLELALAIDPDDEGDRVALVDDGWCLVDPTEVAGDPERFRSYVQGSMGELSVAQEMYVRSECGWFSDRTTRYLASGRPTVVQDTGFSRHLPVGDGLLCFDDLDGAAKCIHHLLADPLHHAAAARQIAEEHFAAGVVLGKLCEELDLAP